jgi:hypothetical protein
VENFLTILRLVILSKLKLVLLATFSDFMRNGRDIGGINLQGKEAVRSNKFSYYLCTIL